MDESGSNFSWFLAYTIASVLLVAALATAVMWWQHRNHRRERRSDVRKSRARARAWRDGKPTPSQQADLEHKKSR